MQRGQGKWYPGEPLPRWQIGLHWRTDGEPLWTDAELLADPWSDRSDRSSRRPDAARQVLAAVADGLDLPPTRCGRPTRIRSPAGREGPDAGGRGGRRGRRPVGRRRGGRAALLARLDDPSRRPRPMCCRCTAGRTSCGWASADWRLRRGRIVLLAGDSPAGLRMPLDSISWEPPRPTFEADPLAERGELAAAAESRTIARTSGRPDEDEDASPSRRWSPRSVTGCCTSSCRPPKSSSTASS